jgi:hypothetical protein
MKKQSQTILIALCVLFALYPIKSQGQHAEVVDGNPGAYLLITSESLADSFQPLVDRRASQGFWGELITIEAIDSTYTGVDIQEKIRNCIKDHYDPCTPLFVALGGDDAVVPVRYCCWPDDPNKSVPTDLYYADLDGGSWDMDYNGIYGEAQDMTQNALIPEVYIGRIPIREPNDVTAYTLKVIKYETVSPDGWARSILFFGGGPSDISGLGRPANFKYHDPISNVEVKFMRSYINWIQPYWQATPFHLLSRWISPWDEHRCGDYFLDASTAIEHLSQGYHFVRFLGHGGFYSWTLHYDKGYGFKREHVKKLRNPIPSIFWAGGCCSGAYDDGSGPPDKDPTMSEILIRNPGGGAVVVVGHTRSLGNNPHPETFYRQIFQHQCHTFGEAFANTLITSAPDVNDVTWLDEHYMFVLLGDPAIHIRLEEESGQNIQLFSPKGCEVIDPNEMDITIRWNAQGTSFNQDDLVKLEYSPDSGASWLSIPGAEALPYNGRFFVWKVAYSIPCGKHYRVRVSLLSDPTVFDGSGQDFTICKCELLTVKVIPNGETSIEGYDVVGPAGPVIGQPISRQIGKQLSYIAPSVDANGRPFLFWTDLLGSVLSTEYSYSFTFEKEQTLIAHYGRIAQYFVNDETPEEGFAPGDDSYDGLSPQTPKRHIHSILDTYPNLACGAVVHISEGNYPENIVLTVENAGITLSGSCVNLTIIDGQTNGSCMTINDCDWCRIQGLTFTNGYSQNGGGLYSFYSCPVITDCSICDNNAENGGGAYFFHGTPTLIDCAVVQNEARHGAGIYNRVNDAVLTRTEFIENTAEAEGGGIYNHESITLLTSCHFFTNQAARGGAVFNVCRSLPILSQCTFTYNHAIVKGGAVYNRNCSEPHLSNCLLVGNSSNNGGAVYSWQDSHPVLTNCTLYGNSSKKQGGAVREDDDAFSTLKNCILWNNTPDQVFFSVTTSQVSFSNIQGGWPWSKDDNIDDDPLFADPDNGDYHLKSQAGRWDPTTQSWVQDDITSPCIDAGDPNSPIGDESIPNGGRINMGAYGGTAEASKSS